MHEQMVGLIVETPLAENNVGSGILDLGDHILEVLLFHVVELFVVSDGFDFKTMLGLGFGWLEWAGEDANLGVLDLLSHLWMREIFIEDDSFDKVTVFNGSSGLGNNLDEVEVDILSVEVSNGEDGSESQVSELVLALRYDLGSESGLSTLSKVGVVVLGNVNFLSNLVEMGDGDVTGLFESVGDLQWVKTLVEQLLGLLQDSSGKDDDTSGTISDFVILGGGKLHQEFGGLMMNLEETGLERVFIDLPPSFRG
jgi:hypothetical protein